MMGKAVAVVLLMVAGIAHAFSPRACVSRRVSPSRVTMMSDAAAADAARELVSVAKTFALANLGAANPSLLADDFACSGPDFVLGRKETYVAGLTRETQVFQAALPDFDLRPYGFAVDETRPDTVWFKIRPRGTSTAPFAYKGEVYAANDRPIELPIQQLSVTVRGGKVSRLTAGYSVDKQSGNTGGLLGPKGVLYALGEKPSPFSYLPVTVALSQLVGRSRKPPSRNARASPFPESVMFSLAKRVVETSYGAEEPDLLTRDFTFSAPLVGPLGKDEHVRRSNAAGLKAGFPDFKLELYNFEIDAFDAERVWLIVKATGTQTRPLLRPNGEVLKAAPEGAAPRYESAPEAVSVSLNEKGLCYRATAGYVLDKEVGNTKGLGGTLGLLEAVGAGRPFYETRTLGDVPRLLVEAVSPPASTVRRVEAPAPPTKPVAPAPKVAPAASEPPKVAEKKVENVRPAVAEKAAAAVVPSAKAPEKKAPPASVEKKDVKAAVAPKAEPAPAGVFSFFGGGEPAGPPASKPAQPKAEPSKPAAAAPTKAVAPASKAAAAPAAPAKAPISAPKKEAAAAPAPKQPEAKKEGGGFFSFLDSAPAAPATAAAAPVKAAAAAPAKAAAAPAKKEAPAAPVKAAAAPAPKEPEAKKGGGGGLFSFLESAPAAPAPASAAKKAEEKAPAPAAPAARRFVVPAKPVTPKSAETATVKKAEPAKAAAAAAPTKETSPSGGGLFGLFGSSAPAAPATSSAGPAAAAAANAKAKAAEASTRADKVKAASDAKRAQQEKAAADAAAKAAADKARRDVGSKARQDVLARQLKIVNAVDKAPKASGNFFIDELDNSNKRPTPADPKSGGKASVSAASKGASVKVGAKTSTKGKESGFV
jgi:hypothetical protein